ncbi:MAG TPA: GNAT family N-acetyltransferase [Actinocrinis sp.]|jgi:ribosomal protein S18 acetylase RimI-like enzyme
MSALRFRLRTAGPGDAEAVALLHADSWRRFYRGAYADSYLDGDVVSDRLAVWSARLAAQCGTETILAEAESEAEGDTESAGGTALLGFVHTAFDDDDRWGSLIDNLHVRSDLRRTGVGRALMIRAAGSVAERTATGAMYLWVLEQNTAAQRFYQALGGARVEKAHLDPPGGDRSKINGDPLKFRMAWPDASLLARGGGAG